MIPFRHSELPTVADAWFILKDQRQHGPFTGANLRQFVASGKVSAQDLVRQVDQTDWVPVVQVQHLLAASPAPPPVPSVPVGGLGAARAAPPPVPGAPGGSPGAIIAPPATSPTVTSKRRVKILPPKYPWLVPTLIVLNAVAGAALIALIVWVGWFRQPKVNVPDSRIDPSKVKVPSTQPAKAPPKGKS
jgi:hypothetical protein